MNKPQKKYSKEALACLEQMSQGNLPSRAEFIAAWNEGLIDATDKGERLMLETVYNRYVLNWDITADASAAEMAHWSAELRASRHVDPAFSGQYESTDDGIAFELQARYFNFINRHELWKQLLAEDTQGKR